MAKSSGKWIAPPNGGYSGQPPKTRSRCRHGWLRRLFCNCPEGRGPFYGVKREN